MPTEFAFLLDAPAVDGDVATCEHPIARLGDYRDPRYGEFSITAKQYQSWKHNFDTVQNGRIPIDYDHRSEKGETEAAGWITSLDLRGEHVVATIEWTPGGAQAVRERRWLYVSPTFGPGFDEQRSPLGEMLHAVALTNRPFLRKGMPAISLSEQTGEFARALDAPVPIEVGDTVREAHDDLSLGREGLVLGEHTAANGAFAYDVAWDDGTVTREAQELSLRNATPSWPEGPFTLNWVEDVGGLPRAIHKLAKKMQRQGMTESRAIAGAVSQAKKFCAKGHGDWCKAVAEWEAKKAKAKSLGHAVPDSPDSPAKMPTIELSKIAVALGLDESADEATVLEAAAKSTETPQVRTLAEQAAAENKIVLDSGQFDELKANAEAGKQALSQLRDQRFTLAYDKALSEGRVDAKPETKERFRKLYDADADSTIGLLADLPQSIILDRPIGDGPGSGATGEAPAGTDQERYELDQQVQARMVEKGEDYSTALNALMDQGVTA